jgi:hypothetical protein
VVVWSIVFLFRSSIHGTSKSKSVLIFLTDRGLSPGHGVSVMSGLASALLAPRQPLIARYFPKDETERYSIATKFTPLTPTQERKDEKKSVGRPRNIPTLVPTAGKRSIVDVLRQVPSAAAVTLASPANPAEGIQQHNVEEHEVKYTNNAEKLILRQPHRRVMMRLAI